MQVSDPTQPNYVPNIYKPKTKLKSKSPSQYIVDLEFKLITYIYMSPCTLNDNLFTLHIEKKYMKICLNYRRE